MKVKIKSVLKSSYNLIDCFDEGQIITRAGSTLAIKQLGKNEAQFICLHPQLQHLFAFKPTTNRKGVFTAQKVQNSIEVAHYNLKGTRKAISLSVQSAFFNEVQKIQLLVDEYDNNVVYGGAKNKEGACVFLADFGKNKISAIGYMNSYEDIRIDHRDNMSLSVCTHNGTYNIVRCLRYTSGQWQITEQTYKKIQNAIAFQHQILPCNRMLFVTRNNIYHFEDTDLLQTLEMSKGEKIREVIKIHRGVLIISQKDTIQVLTEDNDEVTLLSKGYLPLKLEEEDTINRVFLSNSNEEVIVHTVKNHIYTWKCQYLDLEQNHSDFTFVQVEHSCSNSHQGSISISTGRKYCMLAGLRNVTLWSIEKNQYVLSSEFVTEQELSSKKKMINCCAINPDGNSFMLAFEDKIRVYQILLTKFKLLTQYPIKKCQNIVYSHGGQLVACRFGKGSNACIKIINNLRMVEVGSLRVQAEPHQIIWNELDDEIIVSSENNTVQIFSVAQNSRMNSIKCEKKIHYIRIDYRTRRIMISCKDEILIVSNNNVVEDFKPPFEDFSYIYPLYGMYFIATTSGNLHWSSSYKFQHYQSFSLFTQSSFELVCRSGYLLAFSSFDDVMTLQCIRQNYLKNKETKDQIVMVEKQEILEFYEKIKMLQSNFQMLQSATQARLEQQKGNYENAIIKFKKQFIKEIKLVNGNYNDMMSHKVKQEREQQKMFEKLQIGQVESVTQLEKMYERKCKMLQQSLLDLEQKHLEQKRDYENLLKDLEFKYHRDISNIREKYDNLMKEECKRSEQTKNHILEDKKKMEFKLFELEQQNQVTLQVVQIDKDAQINKLKKNIDHLESQIEQLQVQKQTILMDNQRLTDENQDRKNSYEILTCKYEESLNRIKMLEKQVSSKNTMVQEKQRCITELTHQVGGLEKAKYVLSFRTNEIRKELEPKEQLVDKLKNQLMKVDQQYKESKRNIFEMGQKIEKTNKINDTLKKQLFDTKQALNLKQIKYNQLIKQLNHIVKQVDEKEWNQKIRKLQDKYTNEYKHKQNIEKKKDPTEEVNRHLQHVEMSLQQVSYNNDKILRGKEKDIARRMKQNSELMLQINIKKKNQLLLKKMNEELLLEKQQLQKELNENYETKRNSTREQTARTSTRRAVASRDALYSREKSMYVDRQGSRQREMKDMLRDRNRVGSAKKSLMYKDDTREKNAKFFHIARQLQSARNTIKVQEQMLQQLNKQIFAEDVQYS